MDLGVALPQFDYSVPGESPLRWATVEEWATRAEAAGFSSLWLADHLFLSIEKYGAPAGDHGAFDPLVALATLARRTSTARLGTLVLCAQLRPPAVLAKALTTLDHLSGGRLIVGMGAGWFEPEYDAAGLPFRRPGERLTELAEAVQVVKGMFDRDPFSFTGEYTDVDNARNRPRPVSAGGPPVWVGGRGDRLISVAARHADGWNTVWAVTPDTYRTRLDVLHRACDAVGRDPSTVTLSLGLSALVGDSEADVVRRFERLREVTPPGVLDRTSFDEWRAGRLVGTRDQVAEQIEEWRSLGVTTLIVNLGALPFSVTDVDDLDLVASALG